MNISNSGRPKRLRRGPCRLLALGVVVALSAAACSADASGPPRAVNASGAGGKALDEVRLDGRTYRVPQPLPAAPPGTLIAATDHGPDARIGGAGRWTVLHHSADAHGKDIAVSATVLVPRGAAPPGGRPVIAWAHGTTGVADGCAPSQAANLGYNVYAQEAGAFLRAGYAVVATDYPGLGTPGMHTYLVGPDEGNAVVDSVTAARGLLPDLAPTWFAVGHSQGGQAALFAARAAGRSSGTRFGGAVAVAPASHLDVMLPGVIAAHQPGSLAFALYSLAGLGATDPSVDLPRLLGPTAHRTAQQVFQECLTVRHPSLSGITTEQALPLTRAQLASVGGKMAAYGNPDRAAVTAPVLIVQGGADQDVPATWTAQVARNLRALGSPAVTERTYPGSGHDDVLGQSVCDVLAFLGSHNGLSPGGCSPFRARSG
ncbi:serine aminopeptidase domain-containing protein [Streptomyces sp. I05A-00742]|uniref:alpha/beta hydrolase family protein n=1 Tax=Streptomyces sp. I05A-00742 TaxID=2732853 RepID=UPI00289946F9|nr:prolyl oligopeptidase family serine peptidase [Streptomyces sp. I05A-00742]